MNNHDFFNPEKNIENRMLSNGLRVFVVHNPLVPFVECRLVVEAGAADDPSGKSGLAHDVEHLIGENTEKRLGKIEDYFTDRLCGEYYEPGTSLRNTKFGFSCRKAYWPEAIQITFDEVFNYGICKTKKSFLKHNKIILREYFELFDNSKTTEYTLNIYQNLLYDTPYVHPSTILGTPNTISNISSGDIASFYEQYYHYSNSFLVVYGDTHIDEVMHVLSKTKMCSRSGQVPERNLFHLNGIHPPVLKTVKRRTMFDGDVDSKIQIITFGNNHPLDYYIEWVLEGWFQDILREDKKLIYGTDFKHEDLFTINGKIFSVQTSLVRRKLDNLHQRILRVLMDPTILADKFENARQHSLLQYYLIEFDSSDYINYIIDRHSKRINRSPTLGDLFKMEEGFTFSGHFLPLWKGYFNKRTQITVFEKN